MITVTIAALYTCIEHDDHPDTGVIAVAEVVNDEDPDDTLRIPAVPVFMDCGVCGGMARIIKIGVGEPDNTDTTERILADIINFRQKDKEA